MEESNEKQKTSSGKQRDSNIGTPGKKKKAPTPQLKLPKSLPSPVFHQLVGIFTTSAERPPPALDLGLFEWGYFVNIARSISGDEGYDEISAITAKTSGTFLGESSGNLSTSSAGSSHLFGAKWRNVEVESGKGDDCRLFYISNI